MSDWRAKGIRGVWLKVPIEKAALISVAAEHGARCFGSSFSAFLISLLRRTLSEFLTDCCIFATGFTFHHALGKTAMLTAWLQNEKNLIPRYPFTSLGVGCIVINKNLCATSHPISRALFVGAVV